MSWCLPGYDGIGIALCSSVACLPDVRKGDNSGRAGWEPGAGSFGEGWSMVSAHNDSSLLFFIAFCVLVPVPQQAAVSWREELNSVWTSCLGLKGSNDKSAHNESFG